ncbi:MAG: F0F1 ATP synthase subunit delta [Treponema sp.]|jgi:F-type H+-transporting ATPase subunit delta|nr:F0F1 ATP synthase subunit delta [Treponema sp.]
MFVPERWAAAFLAAIDGKGGDAEEGLAVLRILAPLVNGIPAVVSGYAAALKLEGMIRTALDTERHGRGAEAASGLLLLLVQKNALAHVFSVMTEIVKLLDKRNGVLHAVLESAFPADRELADELAGVLREKTGAREVRIESRLVPGLLGGYRLRLGSGYVDASLDGLLRSMTADLNGGF